jgi:hypothetical protein
VRRCGDEAELIFFISGLIILTGIGANSADIANPVGFKWSAEQYSRKTIYHSPQKPGYTCWSGAWEMPDHSLMATFKEVTGPAQGRPRAKLEWQEAFGLMKVDPARDFTGLHMAQVYLRSTNGAWNVVAEAEFAGPSPGYVWSGSHCPLPDGAILRAVDGSAVPGMALPRRVFLQRSKDLGRTWGEPEIPPEPARPVADPNPSTRMIGEPIVMVADREGKNWKSLKIELRPEQRGANVWDEWDSAELPDGNFLCVFRRGVPNNSSKEMRWQGLLRKKNESWVIEQYHPAPFEHSGHPELLTTREGLILHLATDGIYWTEDQGQSWHRLPFKTLGQPARTCYYPRSFQTEDGRIYVLSHQGSDDPYGKTDQAIIMDAFRLVKQ